MSTHPEIDPNRPFTVHGENDIYTGIDGVGNVVPNVDDMVWSWSQGPLRVTAVDPNTRLSTLTKWEQTLENEDTTGDGLLVGTYEVSPQETYRLFVDHSVIPSVAKVDAKLRIYGEEASYIRVFKGTDTTVTGEIISKTYNSSGEFLTDQVELTEVVYEEKEYYRTPKSFNLTEDLTSGEIVTVVVYGPDNGPISLNHLKVIESTLMLRDGYDQKYVQGIEIDSPFKDPTTGEILAPINLPAESLHLYCNVQYHDGSTVQHAIDGTRCSLYGLEGYVASTPDVTYNLALAYKLLSNESSLNSAENDTGNITAGVQLRTLPASHQYNMKLFAYPHWTGAAYIMRYWLFNLDRTEGVEVTDYVTAASGSFASFNSSLYGVEQTLTVSLNLSDVYADSINFRHVQTFGVTLKSEPDNSDESDWVVRLGPTGSVSYGSNAIAKVAFQDVSNYGINIANGIISVSDWLVALYRPTMPLRDSETETDYVIPTHFELEIRGEKTRYEINAYNDVLTTTQNLINGELLTIHWIKETTTKDLFLGASGVAVKVV